jgi:hypothetical protein
MYLLDIPYPSRIVNNKKRKKMKKGMRKKKLLKQ